MSTAADETTLVKKRRKPDTTSGFCTKCSDPKPTDDGRACCQNCLQKARDKRNEKKAKGLCLQCGSSEVSEGYVRCENCRRKTNDQIAMLKTTSGDHCIKCDSAKDSNSTSFCTRHFEMAKKVHNDRWIKLTAACKCTDCPKDAANGKLRCYDCLNARNSAEKARRAGKLAKKQCVSCKEPSTEGSTMCEKHLIASNEKKNEHRKKRNKHRLHDNLCRKCDNSRLEKSVYCSDHYEENLKYMQDFYADRYDRNLCYNCDNPRRDSDTCYCSNCTSKKSENNSNRLQDKNNWKRNLDLVCKMCECVGPPEIFDFDHIRREDKVSTFDSTPLSQINKLVDVCQILCANCHRHKTFCETQELKALSTSTSETRKGDSNRKKFNEEKLRIGCEWPDCDFIIENAHQLDWDHLDKSTKTEAVSVLIHAGYSHARVLEERKNKCRCLCANHHRIHTATQLGWYKRSQINE
jgi:hypothetical protein